MTNRLDGCGRFLSFRICGQRKFWCKVVADLKFIFQFHFKSFRHMEDCCQAACSKWSKGVLQVIIITESLLIEVAKKQYWHFQFVSIVIGYSHTAVRTVFAVNVLKFTYSFFTLLYQASCRGLLRHAVLEYFFKMFSAWDMALYCLCIWLV